MRRHCEILILVAWVAASILGTTILLPRLFSYYLVFGGILLFVLLRYRAAILSLFRIEVGTDVQRLRVLRMRLMIVVALILGLTAFVVANPFPGRGLEPSSKSFLARINHPAAVLTGQVSSLSPPAGLLGAAVHARRGTFS